MTFHPKAVIFDMDGLLVESEPVWYMTETEMVEARGRTMNEETQRGLVGLRMDEYWTEMQRIYELPDSVPALIYESVTRMTRLIPTHVVPRPGAQELLDFLCAKKIPCAIASSSPVAIIEAVVMSQKWEQYFTAQVSGDEVGHGKPAPDVYLETARRLGVNPVDCLALEDSPNGSRAAVAAGMVCYAVPDISHTSHAKFDDITPYVFDNLHDVAKTLGFDS
jgi:HAD superfamily hydrolase (TIGR01509 family)